MRKYILFVFCILAVAAIFSFTEFLRHYSFSADGPKIRDVIRIKEAEFRIEIADSAQERAMGLSGRDSLAQDAGMLFLFEEFSFPAFWMRNMKFPLDMVWIAGDRIVDLSKNVPPPSSDSMPSYSSRKPVNKVLEINAGLVEKYDIRIGDKIEF